MEHIELLKQMISECRDDAERFLSGDKQEYLYCKEKDKEYGDTDKNYSNRTRLCYSLMYGGYFTESIELRMPISTATADTTKICMQIGTSLLMSFQLKRV